MGLQCEGREHTRMPCASSQVLEHDSFSLARILGVNRGLGLSHILNCLGSNKKPIVSWMP